MSGSGGVNGPSASGAQGPSAGSGAGSLPNQGGVNSPPVSGGSPDFSAMLQSLQRVAGGGGFDVNKAMNDAVAALKAQSGSG